MKGNGKKGEKIINGMTSQKDRKMHWHNAVAIVMNNASLFTIISVDTSFFWLDEGRFSPVRFWTCIMRENSSPEKKERERGRTDSLFMRWRASRVKRTFLLSLSLSTKIKHGKHGEKRRKRKRGKGGCILGKPFSFLPCPCLAFFCCTVF